MIFIILNTQNSIMPHNVFLITPSMSTYLEFPKKSNKYWTISTNIDTEKYRISIDLIFLNLLKIIGTIVAKGAKINKPSTIFITYRLVILILKNKYISIIHKIIAN